MKYCYEKLQQTTATAEANVNLKEFMRSIKLSTKFVLKGSLIYNAVFARNIIQFRRKNQKLTAKKK